MVQPFSNDITYLSQIGGAGQLVAGLYVVATPLGNLRDITLRALDVLTTASAIYCEDTRVTQKLLSAYGLQKNLIRCDAHREQSRATEIAQRVTNGEIVALVSDAGTPGISDPGAVLVKLCVALGVKIIPIAGVSAVTTALSVSGMVQTQFTFLGFLPPRAAARKQILQRWVGYDGILVLYEAPQRVPGLLTDLAAMYGACDVVIARELTKKFETIYRGTPQKLQEDIMAAPFKGEVVTLVIPGAAAPSTQDDNDHIIMQLQQLMPTMSLREAVANVTAQTGLPRKVIYALALQIKS